jgi:CubicO group peptidase (beta-lactamase class C family)
MMKTVLVTAVMLIGAAGTRSAAQAAEYDFGPITTSLKKAVEDAPLDGACLLVVQDDKTVYEQCFGKYKPDTIVAIASSSKWLSAATIMTLVDEEKLKLDDPVSKFLPKFTGKSGQITIRQLLSHTSGLPGEHRAIGTFGITLRQAADQIAGVPLVADPGKEFRYGGVSMQVAGAIAEIVSGKSWEELFQERIAKPLAMKSTSYGRLGLSKNPRIAGGASSTMNDYRTFLMMILAEGEFNGRRVLSKESVRQMEHDQTRGAEQTSATLFRLTEGSKYGLGQWLDRQDEHGQGIELSSPGAFGFRPWIDRKHNLLGVFVVEIKDLKKKRSLAAVASIQDQVREVVARSKGLP